MEELSKEKKEKKELSLFELLGPKRSFTFGIVFALMAFSTLGFFYQLANGSSTGSTSTAEVKTFGTTQGATDTSGTESNGAATANLPINPVTSDDHIKGDIDTAEVVIVEYSDLECPFCKRFHPTLEQIVEQNEGKVAWVYRHFPLDSLHSKARKEAEATECAAELGGNDAFWAYLDRLFEITPSNDGLDLAKLPVIASDIGLNQAEFTTCLDSGKYADKVEEHYQDATANAGGQGTPHNVIVSKDGATTPISGAVDINQLQQVIDGYIQS